MSGSAFAVTHHAFSSGAGRTSDGNGSHASTLKSPSYTKSVSWQHYLALLTALLAGCAHDSPCVPVYDDQGRLVHTNTCMKGTTQDNWETAGAIAGGAAAVAGLTMGIIALSK
ncbi:outer membrane protein [Escherichia coli HVH 91 (4-4638751)]|nr:outer membrane protein [Escherichia coli HVH 91 (4-4638751)]